jgi:hypothetical protein
MLGLAIIDAQELDQVGGLGQHEQHRAGGAIGIVGKGARRGCVQQPLFELVLALDLQGLQQGFEPTIALGPERAEHIGDQDAAGLQPDVIVLAAGVGHNWRAMRSASAGWAISSNGDQKAQRASKGLRMMSPRSGR